MAYRVFSVNLLSEPMLSYCQLLGTYFSGISMAILTYRCKTASILSRSHCVKRWFNATVLILYFPYIFATRLWRCLKFPDTCVLWRQSDDKFSSKYIWLALISWSDNSKMAYQISRDSKSHCIPIMPCVVMIMILSILFQVMARLLDAKPLPYIITTSSLAPPKLSKWQLSMQPVTKSSSEWHFHFKMIFWFKMATFSFQNVFRFSVSFRKMPLQMSKISAILSRSHCINTSSSRQNQSHFADDCQVHFLVWKLLSFDINLNESFS